MAVGVVEIRMADAMCKRVIQMLITICSGKMTPTHPPRNANNIEPYTFVTLFWEI